MQVLADNILIKPIPWPEQKHGSIVMPDNLKSKEQLGCGEILGVGPGGYTVQGVQLPPDVEVGAIVYYLKRSAVPVLIKECECHLIPERELLMALTAEEVGRDYKGEI